MKLKFISSAKDKLPSGNKKGGGGGGGGAMQKRTQKPAEGGRVKEGAGRKRKNGGGNCDGKLCRGGPNIVQGGGKTRKRRQANESTKIKCEPRETGRILQSKKAEIGTCWAPRRQTTRGGTVDGNHLLTKDITKSTTSSRPSGGAKQN